MKTDADRGFRRGHVEPPAWPLSGRLAAHTKEKHYQPQRSDWTWKTLDTRSIGRTNLDTNLQVQTTEHVGQESRNLQ